VAQSKFNWGMKGYQVGPKFDAQAYNQAPGSATPWGLQQLAKPLTSAQIADLIAGRPMSQQPVAAPATRAQAYNPASMITPNATNVYQLPTVRTTPVSSNAAVSAGPTALEQQLAYDQQQALAQGDNALYWDIQARLDALKNGTATAVAPVAPPVAPVQQPVAQQPVQQPVAPVQPTAIDWSSDQLPAGYRYAGGDDIESGRAIYHPGMNLYIVQMA
jgi:hypothetical protein